MGLISDWFDLRVAEEWGYGLPEGFENRVSWRMHGRALLVGLAGPADLIYFKLVAAADGQHARHLQDLRRLEPTDAQLEVALSEARRRNVGLDADLDRVAGLCREARHA